MNVLLLGSGGREYTLAWKISQSPLLTKLFIAPGNGGTESFGENVSLKETDFDGIAQFVEDKSIDLIVVGPEAPLVAGLRDTLENDARSKNVSIVGPGKAGALLEGSKDFSKQFMQKHGIPTAAYQTFTKATLAEGQAFLETLNPPYVLKADGLAGGKGVLIIDNLEEAKSSLAEMFSGKFGDASASVVIEEFLDGIELSVFVLTDGTSYVVLPEAKDYKRIGEGDTGLNTGGMGAVSPVPFAQGEFLSKVEERIIKPTINGLAKDKISYQGFVFIGLMNVNGDPYVIEYNVRMGDPETEAVLPRITDDLLPILKQVGDGHLEAQKLSFSEKTALTVMTVSGGYPESYPKGKEMTIGFENQSDILAIHAGTAKNEQGVATSGGRVLAVTALAESIEGAQKKAYKHVDLISFEGMYFRRDIGNDLL